MSSFLQIIHIDNIQGICGNFIKSVLSEDSIEWLVVRQYYRNYRSSDIFRISKTTCMYSFRKFLSAGIICYIYKSPVLLSLLADHFSLFCGPLLQPLCWYHCRVDAHICDIHVFFYIFIIILRKYLLIFLLLALKISYVCFTLHCKFFIFAPYTQKQCTQKKSTQKQSTQKQTTHTRVVNTRVHKSRANTE